MLTKYFFFFLNSHGQINHGEFLNFGATPGPYGFRLFGGAVDNRRTGRIYYGIRTSTIQATNFQCLILSAFNISGFDHIQIVVITYDRLPHIRGIDDSAVSHKTN